MRKGIAAIAAAGSVFAFTAAAAATVTITTSNPTVTTTTSGSTTITSNQCTAVSATNTYDAGNAALTEVALSSTDADCAGLKATLTAGGTGNATFSTGTSPYTATITVAGGTLSDGSNTVSLSIAPAA